MHDMEAIAHDGDEGEREITNLMHEGKEVDEEGLDVESFGLWENTNGNKKRERTRIVWGLGFFIVVVFNR